ncbi:hypothetical protein [Microlunatus soli]|uniref:Esterase-like activity of phytase n=1 Tax=Microlunatus soli TaxID=630515 RepID=A0A1H2AMM9_9ACTN|nr:hypothetical protein [Microlunatus soli]SDT47087.1 hypothetical protein SAMN04489812_6059 [Microlunatus soli]
MTIQLARRSRGVAAMIAVAVTLAVLPWTAAAEPGYTVIGTVTDPELIEPSGLAASRVNPGVLYTHGEDNPYVVALDSTDASVVGRYRADLVPWDWEDAAVGPCPTGSCIYFGDIGKESGRAGPQPTTFAIHRVAEPDLAEGESSGTLHVDTFRFAYPDGAKNAEALMVHPVNGRIYVLTKSNTGWSGIYTFPKRVPQPGDGIATLRKVGELQLPTREGDTNFSKVTAAAIHPKADRFLIRTYKAVYEFGRPGKDLDKAFVADPVRLVDTAERQGETIEYAPDGSGYFTMGEENAPPYTLKFVAHG